jgi:TonB-linked SusC/RagA family outer membrane protein
MNNYSFVKSWAVSLLPKIISILSLLAITAGHAQTTTLKGTVTDTNGTMLGVTVLLKGTSTGTLTNETGQYQITAKPTDTLVFSYMGYKTVERPIASQTTINLSLQEDTTTLQEVILNAGYYSVKEKERTGSIAKITAKDIETQPVTNVLATMQGRMTGVSITQETGSAGGGFNIRIRGTNSIRTEGNEPLYIVNGMPYASQSLGSTNLISGILPNANNPLNNINPADIESIEVLKDADATAIYGSRGANGVVLITTKKGKQGKTQFAAQASTTIGSITRKLDLLNTSQYLAMRKEAFANDGMETIPESAYDSNGTWDENRYTDWQKKLIGGTAIITNYQGTISGGSSQTQYLISGTIRKETTVYPGENKYKRGVVNASINHTSENNKFNLQFSSNYSADKNTLPGVDLTKYAYTLAPNAPELYQENGALNWENGTFDNPLGFLNGKYQTNTNNLISNLQLSYKLLLGLELKSNFGYTDTRMVEVRTIPTTVYNPFDVITNDMATLYLNNSNRQSWIMEPQLNWNKEWNKIKVNVLLGTTFQNNLSQQLVQSGSGFTSNALINNMAAAANRSILNHQEIVYKYNAFFGRMNLNWEDKYILNLTGRRDGSSRFGPGNRFANFGAMGAAWIFSNEAMFKNQDYIVSFGKIRASIGTSGNDQIGDYQFLDTYNVTSNNYQGIIGLEPTRLFNPNFGWETNKKIELALELGLWNDNVFLTTAYFSNRSSNQLVGVPLPATTGFPSIQENFDATVQNTGLEIDIRTVNVKGSNFKWVTTLNFTQPKNELIEFKNLEASTYANALVIGQPLNIIKLYNLTGINPETGVYEFQDVDNDGQIAAPNDRQVIGNLNPDWFGGLGNQINYKNWELDVLFQFVKQQGRNFGYFFPVPGSFSNQPAEVLNHGAENGATAASQLYTSGTNPDAVQAFSRYTDSNASVSDASFVRLKSISLSYNLPSNWTRSFSGRIYLQGQNLLTFTKYRGADPENQTSGYLPPLRQWTIGLQFNL